MNAIFHDMLHNYLEDYVGVNGVKSKEASQHINDLKKVFLSEHMNPLKCSFGVFFGKLLGFTVHGKGIDLDVDKANAIEYMEPPMMCKQLKSFMGRVS